MDKNAFKSRATTCAITGAILPEDLALFDVDRVIEKHQGGIYTPENTRALTARAHMERHGNLRERGEWLEELKSIMDDRSQTMKVVLKLNNQLLAYQRQTDHARASTEEFLAETLETVHKRLRKIDAEVTKHVKSSDDPLVLAAMGVVGVGPITVAGLQTYIDLEKAGSASAMWKYVGLHAASHDRYTKGEAGGGNKTLRTIIWNTANSMTKNRDCPYRVVYDQTKDRLAASEKIVKSRNTQGHLVEVPWKNTKPSHRHGAALRAIMKHFLADYWFVGRTLAGLDARPLYVEEKLGHSGIVRPVERGWEY